MNKKTTVNGSVLMVTQHISRQQNMQSQSNKNQVEPMALVMKKAYDSNIFSDVAAGASGRVMSPVLLTKELVRMKVSKLRPNTPKL